MKIKRPITLIGAILGTVNFALVTLFAIISLFCLIHYVSVGNTEITSQVGPVTYVVFVFMIAFFAFTLACNAVCIKSYVRGREAFQKFKPLTITTVVLNFLFIVIQLGLTFLANLPLTALLIFMTVFFFAMAIAANVLYIIDLCLENGRAQADGEPTLKGSSAQPDSPDLNQLSAKLQDLENMKKNKLISDEEYKNMRQKILKL